MKPIRQIYRALSLTVRPTFWLCRLLSRRDGGVSELFANIISSNFACFSSVLTPATFLQISYQRCLLCMPCRDLIGHKTTQLLVISLIGWIVVFFYFFNRLNSVMLEIWNCELLPMQ